MERHSETDGRAHRAGLVGLLAVLALACGPGGERDEERAHAPATAAATPAADAAPAFAGRAACAGCHPDEARRWTGSHHDLAMQEAGERSVLGDFRDATFTYAGTTSRFFRRDGRFLVATDGPGGTVRDYEIAYTFGAAPLQQYLVALPGGRLQALGIAWDARPAAAGGQRWLHLYPDDAVTHASPLHWTRPSQSWNDRCAACHSTGLRKRWRAEASRYETTWAEIDVSCEACHGPGAAHAAWARGGGAGARAESPPVRFPTRAAWVLDAAHATASRARPLESRAEVEACAPCHARRTDLASDVTPGTPFLAAYEPALLEEGLYFADGQIQGEVYEYGSFLQSRMYAAGVTCGDCHDPHDLRLRADGNALCTGCHRASVFDAAAHHFHPPASPGARCVACHMPARTYMQVDERRDHGFRVPRPDLSARLGVPNVCQACHADRTPAWAAEAIAARTGGARLGTPHYGDAIAAGRGAAVTAVPLLAGVADDAAVPPIARATALALLGARHPVALAAIGRGAAHDDPLVRLAAMRALEGGDAPALSELAAPRLRDPVPAVRLAAARALAGAPPPALRPEDEPALREALATYERGLLGHADRPEALAALGELYVKRGRTAEAEAVLRTSIRLVPYFIPAYVNLADVHRAQGRDAEGESLLRAALAHAPENADLHHALGLLLVRRGLVPAAIDELARAAALAPDEPRHAYVLGVALHSTGDSERALDVLRAARRRAPADRDVLLALASISRERGQTAAARTYANALAALDPWDRAARALQAQLGDGPDEAVEQRSPADRRRP